MPDSISVKAPAKINLSLDILGKKQNGYHIVRTIMQAISLYDDITVTKNNTESINIFCDNPSVPCDKTNLVYKAAEKFFAHINRKIQGFDIHITKRIPSMAGLAGGSADAAATLVALDYLMDTHLSDDVLCLIGSKVGADVPFCIKGATAVGEDIGDILTPLPPLSDCYIVVVKPDVSISTPEAFIKYDSIETPATSDFNSLVMAIKSQNIAKTSALLFNALEYASDHPQIISLKNKILKLGASGSLMTGSGSAVYGIFTDKLAAEKCIDILKKSYNFVKICSPVDNGVIFVD